MCVRLDDDRNGIKKKADNRWYPANNVERGGGDQKQAPLKKKKIPGGTKEASFSKEEEVKTKA